ncbi:hypothetical protein B0J11DRAFT_442111, partial [Dendryphion nanum]
APFIKPYRSNLTALSHEYNHFYYASKDTIIVCEPGFPDQKFSNAPALTLYPPVSAPNLTFYMDRITPHSINQLHVDYLGKEEILLAVCDDGDIIGYRTTAIQAALQMKATKREDNWNPQPRTILHRNVGKSAWGLAVHREARLVAISANNHLITIIAFALTAPPTAEEQIPHNSRTSFRPHGDFPRDRTKDDVFTVTANSNIPSVAFDNTGDDPSGRWLFGSDIQGMTHLYDLHHRHTTSQKIHTPSSPPCVIISKEEIYLLQSSYGAHALLDFSPIVTMHNPLYHETECYDEKDPWTQRHNLFAQIPELGIFIVGANTGRCAVYSFTRVKTKALPTESEHIIYGFRQDFILPFDQQETRGHAVPKHEFLAGIAVGPVQGSLNSERTVDNGASVNRRWRIILLFSEHTVLSYEVGRKCEPGALELGDLMV